MGGDLACIAILTGLSPISTHATHEGGDFQIISPSFSFKFQLTPPMRVATKTIYPPRIVNRFQLTPPMRVATFLHLFYTIQYTHFNSRHPYGWRPKQAQACATHDIFQLTPPLWVATLRTPLTKCIAVLFQLTPPLWVATDCRQRPTF